MLTFTFPTNVQLDILTQEYYVDRSKFIGERLLPFMEFQTQIVRWDELDVDRGMTAPHAMDSDPRIDKRPGSKTREYEPIAFKESDLIKESEILRARELGTLAGSINLDALVARTLRLRQDKTYVRAEWLRWQALQGGFAIDENGVKVSEAFNIQTYDASDWTNHATATPLKDFNTVKLLFRATGASAQGATAYMNQATANHLLENINQDDLRGFQNPNFAALPYSVEEINKILSTRGLPTIEVYDEGYIDEAGAFQLFLPNFKVVVAGKRMRGQVVGNFAMTPTLHRSRNGLAAPGFFSFLEVNGGPNQGSASISIDALGQSANPNIKITGGVYGGPLLWYPRSIVRVDVGP